MGRCVWECLQCGPEVTVAGRIFFRVTADRGWQDQGDECIRQRQEIRNLSEGDVWFLS